MVLCATASNQPNKRKKTAHTIETCIQQIFLHVFMLCSMRPAFFKKYENQIRRSAKTPSCRKTKTNCDFDRIRSGIPLNAEPARCGEKGTPAQSHTTRWISPSLWAIWWNTSDRTIWVRWMELQPTMRYHVTFLIQSQARYLQFDTCVIDPTEMSYAIADGLAASRPGSAAGKCKCVTAASGPVNK